MSLIDRLGDFLRGAVSPGEAPADAALTVAALLALVARVDGRLLQVEEDDLKTVLQSRFALAPGQADSLLAAAEAIRGETDSALAIAERIRHDVAEQDRAELLAAAYRLAAADGHIHDFEDDLIWRVGRLLGFGEDAIAAIRAGAAQGEA